MTTRAIPSVTMSCAVSGASTRSNELGIGRWWEKAASLSADQVAPASGKSRALMFIALDKLHNQGIAQAIVVVPERTIGASFEDARLSEFGFWADWTVRPKWNATRRAATEARSIQ